MNFFLGVFWLAAGLGIYLAITGEVKLSGALGIIGAVVVIAVLAAAIRRSFLPLHDRQSKRLQAKLQRLQEENRGS
jgi:hypothetical protein